MISGFTRRRTSLRAAAAAVMSLAMLSTTVQAMAEDPVPGCTITANVAAQKAYGVGANMWGSASGCTGTELVAEANVGGTWTKVGSMPIEGDSGYVLAMSGAIEKAGTHTLRARIADDTSNTVQMVRFAKPTASSASAQAVGVKANVWGTFPGAPGATVWTEVWKSSGWSTSQTGRTTSTGGYTLPLSYGINTAGTYTYRVAVRYPDGSIVRTDSFKFVRRGLPTINTAGSAKVNVAANAWGSFPGGAGIPVWTEVKLPNGTWSRSASGKASSSGGYTLALTYGANAAGTYQFRVAGQYPDGTVVHSKAVSFTRINPAYDLDRRCLTGRALCASKTTRKLHWVVDGKVLAVMDARFGSVKYPTREGQFSVGWKSRYHTSSLYGSYMPWAMFFSGGQAIHYSENFKTYGYNHPGSHGCINIRDAKTLDWVYNQVRTGDKVVVHW